MGVWRNTTFDDYPNQDIYDKIAKDNLVFLCKDSLTALRVISAKKNSNLFVISNGRDAEFFVKKQLLEHLKIKEEKILVFTGSVDLVREQLKPKNILVTDSPDDVEKFVNDNSK